MRNILYYIMAILLCSVLDTANLYAQNAALKFDSEKWNFGKIAEDGGNVEHTFTFTNTSSKPVVIIDVTTSCGCTTPSYSRKPIMSGQKGEIVVSIDPMNRPGHFSKVASVLTSASEQTINLSIEGTIEPRVKSIEEQYPFDIGEGVRLSSNFHAFAYVGRGESVEQTIGWINTSKSDVRINFIEEQGSGLFTLEYPKVLPAGERGEMKLKYTVPASSDKYGTMSDVYAIEVNGKKSKTSFSTHAIAVDKFDNANDDISAPIAELSKKFIKFGDLKYGRKASDVSVTLANDGEKDLIIRAVEWQSNALECSLKAGDKIRKGQKMTLNLTLDTSKCDYGVWVDRIKIITNDPTRPMQTMRVTAIIID